MNDNVDVTSLIYGDHRLSRLVAVERANDRQILLYRRSSPDSVESELVQFEPWLITTTSGTEALGKLAPDNIQQLSGDHPLRYLLTFSSWTRFLEARRRLQDDNHNHPSIALGNPVAQYLTGQGRSLFMDMTFEDLTRLQLDIETRGLDPASQDAAVILIALSTNRGHREIIDAADLGEGTALEQLARRIREIDPDVIEGHNIFNFDLPYLLMRARRNAVQLNIGRNGTEPRLGTMRRVKFGPRSVPFQSVHIFGRQIIDTYQQIQRYDANGELESYGLKDVIEALGMTRSDRVLIAGDQVASMFDKDQSAVYAYALGDVADTALLSSLATPTEFYQTQIIPRSLQDVAVGGPGEKINSLMLRVYLGQRHSLPLPDRSKPYPGGYTEVRHTGIFHDVVKCDVESLYPAIMLSSNIAPKNDDLGVYLKLLATLTERRLDAKRKARTSSGAEHAIWQGMQLSFKVLINSFYGYLGYGRAYFSDFDAAEQVTLEGQRIILKVVGELERRKATVIEVDTDGVYFAPDPPLSDEEDEARFVSEVGATLPSGIILAHDGSFRGMISLRTKNYALETRDGRVILKGSSLRSRREEPVLREFLSRATRAFIEGSQESVRSLYLDTAEKISNHQVAVQDLCRWETITEKTFTSQANRQIASVARGERVGERVRIYRRVDGSFGLIDDYAADEDIDYLLRRLRDMAERFRPLFASDRDFSYHFPALSSRTDFAVVREDLPTKQMSLFDLSPE